MLRMSRYDLTDFEWRVIEPLLPNKPRGVPRVDDRCVLNGIFWVLRSGAPWRDLPERYGDWKATHKRFRRWCESGVFARVLGALALDADAEYMSIDSTSIRAHQHSAGAQKKMARIKPSADPAAG